MTIDDGFTVPYIVHKESGTWMAMDECTIVYLTPDQTVRFTDMSDSDRIDYAIKHGNYDTCTVCGKPREIDL